MAELETTWARVDSYVETRLHAADPALVAALTGADAAGLPPIQISPAQGALLQVLARAVAARRVLEIGTLGGYSAIWLARALPPDGRLVTLELDPRHAAVATAALARAGLADRVEVMVGPALSSLAVLAQEQPGPYDLVFIDADKPSNTEYVRWALRLTRPGSLIVVDNVVRDGALADPVSSDPSVVGAQALVDLLAAEPRLVSTVVQTVGAKGYDGFAVSVVLP